MRNFARTISNDIYGTPDCAKIQTLKYTGMQNVEPPPFVWPEKLYIRLSNERLHFARYNEEAGAGFIFSVCPIRRQLSAAEAIQEACAADSVAQGPSSSVEILINSAATPIPLTDFQEEDCEAYYYYCFPDTKKKSRVFYDIVAPANVVLLFALDEAVCQTIEKRYDNVHYSSALTPVLRHFAQKRERPGERKRLFAYCQEATCDIAIFENGQLLLLNRYEVHDAADTTYYILNVAQQLGINSQNSPLTIAGTGELRNATGKELEQYAPNVCYLNPVAEFQRHPISQKNGVPYDLMTLLIN